MLCNSNPSSLTTDTVVPWSLTMDVLKAAYTFHETSDARQFLDEYFIKIVDLTMQQRYEFSLELVSLFHTTIILYSSIKSTHSPAKFGQFEKTSFEDIQLCSLQILLKVLPARPEFLIALVRIFDPSIPFYSGKLQITALVFT